MKNKIILLILGVSLIGFLLMSNPKEIEGIHDLGEGSLVINELIPKNKTLYPDSAGDYYDLIEIFNPTSRVIDLTGMGLSDDPEKPHLWTFESGEIKPGDYLIIFAAGFDDDDLELNGYYTNFKLKAEGERVLLSDDNGDVISIVSYAGLSNDMSVSLIDNDYVTIYVGTPGEENQGVIIKDINEYNQKLELLASHESGIYNQAISLSFEAYESYELRYTLDGSDPTSQSLLYETSIELAESNLNKTKITNNQSTFYLVDKLPDKFVNKGTVLKARYFENDVPLGEMFVGTYFIWEDGAETYSFDIVSLVTDPSHLYDPVTGIYVVGDKYEKEAPSNPDGGTPANYNQRGREWERDANIEFFTSDGELVYDNGIGIRMFGGWSRANTKKSFKLFARSEYGEKIFDYPFFENMLDENGQVIDSFERLLLRTGGNDGEYALFRDPLADSLIDGMLDYQQYKQVILFLNGEYWGIYHLREHMDENYLASHYDVKANDVNIIAYNPDGLESYAGDKDELKRFEEFMKFVDEENMADASNYKYVKDMLDVDNFIDYYITQMFINNVDWPSNNAKVWRYTGKDDSLNISDGKYRYLLYDTEFSFGLYSGAAASAHNYFEFLHAVTDEPWPNPMWATSFYRNFMENDEFKAMFILRLTDLLNSRFSKELVIERINEMKDLYKPEMEDYLNRWNFWAVKDINSWETDQMYILREFSEKRGSYLLNYAKKQYELDDLYQIRVEAFEGGSIVINNTYKLRFSDVRQGTINEHVESVEPLFTVVKDSSELLNYFGDYNIEVKAEADEGYRFVGWEIETKGTNGLKGLIVSGDLSSQQIELHLEGNSLIKAVFEKVLD